MFYRNFDIKWLFRWHIKLEESNDYTIGGDIYNLKQNNRIKIDRAIKLYENKDNFTNILVKCIDD